MAYLIGTDGAISEIHPQNKAFDIQELQKLVKGRVESIPIAGGRIMYINEDGKLLGMDFNPMATQMADKVIANADFIAGPAVVCSAMESGEEEYLPDDLDACDETQLRKWAERYAAESIEDKDNGDVYDALKDYTFYRAEFLRERRGHNMGPALRLKTQCNRIYESLPTWARWERQIDV